MPGAVLANVPATASQRSAPLGPITSTIGSTHGCGRPTLASMSDVPEELAPKSPVLILTMAVVPSGTVLRQLTTTRNAGNGFVPRKAAGTEG